MASAIHIACLLAFPLFLLSLPPLFVSALDVEQAPLHTRPPLPQSSPTFPPDFKCRWLAAITATNISLPYDPTYTRQQSTYFTAQQQSLSPGCRITPTSLSDIPSLLHILTRSTEITDLPFAIRAGGHSWVEGWSNTNSSGATIDLERLNEIQLAEHGSTVRLGPGARWRDVYAYLEERGLSVSGARDGGVGVGGFVLGGGLNLYSNRLGWACDAVRKFRVVAAPNLWPRPPERPRPGQIFTIVNASREENPDLFWALKGSGGAAGLVVELEMEVVPQQEFYAESMSYDKEEVGRTLSALVELNANTPNDLDTIGYLGAVYGGINGGAEWEEKNLHVNMILFNLAGNSSSEAMRPFKGIPSLRTEEMVINASTLAEETDRQNPRGFRQLKSTFTVSNFAPVLRYIWDLFENSLLTGTVELGNGPQDWTGVLFQPLTVPMLSHSTDNVLGPFFTNDGEVKEPLILFSLETRWRDAAADERIKEAFHRLHDMLLQAAGPYVHPFVYPNYAAEWQDPFAGGGADREHLRRVIERFDADGGYARRRRGGFKP